VTAGVHAVLLAGGLSRRMGGGDKSLARFGDGTMLGFIADRIARQVDGVLVNANGDPGRFADLGLPVVPDTVGGFAGPLAGILAGLQWLAENRPEARWALSLATDTPFFPDSLAARLLAAAAETCSAIALARSGARVHPVIGLWRIDLAGDLAAWLASTEQRKVLAFVDRHRWTEVDFDERDAAVDNCDPFFNTNTPEDLATATRLLGPVVT